MSPPKIAFEQVSCSFLLKDEEVRAVGNVSLDIADGEIVTLVGPSGCGKSTLMNMVAGLQEPTGGRVLVDGAPVDGPGPKRGVIFQQYALFPWRTVAENVAFGLEIAGVPAVERSATVARCLDLVGLSAFAGALPKNLSGGMKQRCAIARAYAVNPAVLLMDEPFGALDALTRITLQDQLLDTWKRDRRTILFITHDVDEAVYLAHRVIVMAARPGRIHAEIPVDLPYPRDEAMRLSPEFRDLRNRVWNAVFHQH
ncbi:MAG: ATP-binding cassette domain-containing protein [Alphaproteobacteria bacterium]|nr:ATP-binding cassette domain-containing protein [Alphaproteobacteria bacterium]